MPSSGPQAEHLLRRAGFGARPDELRTYGSLSIDQAIAALVNYEGIPDDVDDGGLYGTAPNLNMDPKNTTLENSANDVTFETDFRSVYAQVIDNWLGASSTAVLGGDSRQAGLTFI